MTRLGYRPALDGVRGVAIAIVLVGHTLAASGVGYFRPLYGVEVFFVLSGFLITTLLLEEHERHGRVSLPGFYRRRALRLLPALVVALGFFAVFVASSRGEAVRGVALGLGYVSNVVGAWSPARLPHGVEHLWSLATEEQFYLLWPLALVAALRFRVPRVWVLGGLGVLLVATSAERVRLWLGPDPGDYRYFGPDLRAGGLLVGCALAFMLVGRPRRVPPLVTTAALMVTVGFVAASAFADLYGRRTPLLVVFQLAAAVVIAAALADGATGRVLSVTPLVFLGRISYGLYLWHVMLLWLRGDVPPVAIAALSVGVAWLSYKYVETPFLRMKRRPPRERAAPDHALTQRYLANPPEKPPVPPVTMVSNRMFASAFVGVPEVTSSQSKFLNADDAPV